MHQTNIRSLSSRRVRHARSSEKNERDRVTRALKGVRGGSCSSCQTRVMDTSHCGKLTNTPWRPSDTRTHTRVPPSRTSLCDFHAESSHTYVHARAPTHDKHERVYVGSLLRKRNEMKRPFHRVAADPSLSRSFPPPIPCLSSRAFPRAWSPMLDRRTNDDRPSDACVHTCASTHSGSPLMSARSSARMHSADAPGCFMAFIVKSQRISAINLRLSFSR